MPSEYEHFGDLSPEEHLKEVQDMHKVCKGEPHQTKKGGWYHLASDAIDCGVFIFFIRTVFFLTPTLPLASYGKLLLATGVSWIFYTSCKCAQSAWAYMELTHRNMLQEKKRSKRTQNKSEWNYVCCMPIKDSKSRYFHK